LVPTHPPPPSSTLFSSFDEIHKNGNLFCEPDFTLAPLKEKDLPTSTFRPFCFSVLLKGTPRRGARAACFLVRDDVHNPRRTFPVFRVVSFFRRSRRDVEALHSTVHFSHNVEPSPMRKAFLTRPFDGRLDFGFALLVEFLG